MTVTYVKIVFLEITTPLGLFKSSRRVDLVVNMFFFFFFSNLHFCVVASFHNSDFRVGREGTSSW